MKVVLRAASLTALLALGAAAPATAQRWKWDIGINGGYSWFTKMLDSDQTGLSEDIPGSEIFFDHGPLFGLQVTYWAAPRVALRLNGRYASNDIKGNDLDDFDFVEDVNLWGGTLDLMYRFREPADEFAGLEFLPYLALGGGLKWYNPAGDSFTCTDTDGDAESCGPFTTGLPNLPRTFAIVKGSSFAGLIGLGADWRLGRGFALRTEISDQIFKPEVKRGTFDTPTTVDLTSDDSESKWIHEIGAQLGLQFLLGVQPAPVVAVQPAPTPPPAQPEPQPQPEREEAVTVCVIDPTAAGGIRMESAIFRPERGDTLVTVNGQRVPLRNAVGNVPVASNAAWYVQGQPLVMNVGSERVQFLTYGSARVIEGSNLALLGTINGMPVYADADEVQDVRAEIDELNRTRRGADLGEVLAQNRNLREELADVTTLYVPLQTTGCLFQAVQRQEQVRKSK